MQRPGSEDDKAGPGEKMAVRMKRLSREHLPEPVQNKSNGS